MGLPEFSLPVDRENKVLFTWKQRQKISSFPDECDRKVVITGSQR
jgi:hypothetical protein